MSIIENYTDRLRNNPLFNELGDEDFIRLTNVMEEPRHYDAGEMFIREGEVADCFFVIAQGSVEILKKEPDSDKLHRLTVLRTCDSVGELLLLDPGIRSASARTLEETKLIVIPFSLLHSLSEGENTLESKIKLKAASILGKHLRQINDTTVKSFMETYQEINKRAKFGAVVTKMLLGACLYIYTLGIVNSTEISSSTYVTLPLVIIFLGFVVHTIMTGGYPLETYGITLKNWRFVALDSLKFTAFAVFIVILFKIALVSWVPAYHGLPVFDWSKSLEPSSGQLLLLMAIYGLFIAPIEEIITRGGIQASLQIYLLGKHKNLTANIVTCLLFSAGHVFMSLTMAIVTFPVALFWGWLFSRHNSVVGPAVSHAVLGTIAFFVIGLPIA